MATIGLCDRPGCGGQGRYRYRVVQVENPDAWEHIGGANIDVCSRPCLDSIMKQNIAKYGKFSIQRYEDD